MLLTIVGALQMTGAALLLLVSPVAGEQGIGMTVFLASAGVLGLVGGRGVMAGKRWGFITSLGANALFGGPMLVLAVQIAVDLARGNASLASAGAFFWLPALVPVAFAAVLVVKRRAFT